MWLAARLPQCAAQPWWRRCVAACSSQLNLLTPSLLTVTLKRPYKSPAFCRAPSNNTVGLGPAVGEKKGGLLWPAMDMVKVELLANNAVLMCCVVIQIMSTPPAEREASSNCASTPFQNKSRPPSLLCDPCADLLRCTWWA